MRILIQTGLLLGAATLGFAQAPPEDHFFQVQVAPPPGAGAGAGMVTRSGAMGFVRAFGSGETVKGSPYSAEAVTETTQTLADGNRIVNRNTSKQYRDSEGRERREMSIGAFGGPGAEEFQTVLITDPVAGTTYSVNPRSRTADKMPMPQIQVFKGGIAMGIGSGTGGGIGTGIGSVGSVQSTQIMIQSPNGATGAELGGPNVMVFNDRQVVARVAGDAGPKTENLGTSTIEGVLAEGTRTRTVIPAGQMGNEKPIEVVGESWYSPDLKMTILTKNSDPRMGETVFKLTNISRTEPARALFEVPPGYTLNEGPKGTPGQRIQVIQRELH